MANFTASLLTYTGNVANVPSFNPTTDVLNFDNAVGGSSDFRGVSANRVFYNWSGSTLNIGYAGQTIALNMSAYYSSAGLSTGGTQPPIQLLTPLNVTFWNGTKMLVGDQTFGGPGTTGNDTQSGLTFNGTNVFYSGNDSITPSAGDVFASFGANATMNGGAGDDWFNIHGPNNPEGVLQTIVINGGAGGDRVQLLAGTAQGASVNLRNQNIFWGQTTIQLSSVESVRGTALNDSFMGGQNNFQWVDLDSLNFVPGTLSVEFQVFTPNLGYDNIWAGGTGDGTRMIVDYANTTGLARISMQAPFGDDNNNSYRQVTKYNGNGTVQLSDTIVGMDNLNDVTRIAGTNGNDLLYGGSNARSVFGTLQEEFQGFGGADTIDGAGGFDLVLYGNAAFGVNINLSNGHAWDGSNLNANTDGVGGGNVRDTLINVEGVSAGNFNDTIVGSAANNYMGGVAGSDYLNGGDGFDTSSYSGSSGAVYADLSGGFANDVYVLPTNGTLVPGSDTLVNIEELRGSDFNDTLIGGSSSSTYLSPGAHPVESFEGRAGNDRIVGAAFNQDVSHTETDEFRTNFAKYQRAPEAVSIDLGLATGVDSITGAGGTLVVDDGYGGQDTLISINGLIGSRFDDALVGDQFRNALRGEAGDDIMDGGGGIDTATYGDSPDNDGGIFADLELGIAYDGWGYWNSAANNGTGQWVDGGLDTLINIENVQGSNFDDQIRGDDNPNTIWGLDGGDLLDSRDAGPDTLYGGAGDDLYWTRSGDVVNETTNDGVTDAGGHDKVLAFSSFTAPNFVENVWLRGTGNFSATGNTLGNKLRGNAGNNKLSGLGGNDTIQGGLGNDTLIGGSGVDWASYDDVAAGVIVDLGNNLTAQNTGGAGLDLIQSTEDLEGSRFGDLLTGSSAANVIKGGSGNDTISGGLGLDTLIGDGGRDQFLFNTTPSAGNVDTIADFQQGTDKIVLDASIFTAFTVNGPVSSNNFRNTANASTPQQFLLYTQAGGNLYYDPTGNGGGGSADRVQIATLGPVNGVVPALTAADFVIIGAA